MVTILKNALLFTGTQNFQLDRYSLYIKEKRITDIVKTREPRENESEQPKILQWMEQSGGKAEIFDCSKKLIIPSIVNSCVKSEGSFVKYLLRKRHYENGESDICTDLIFNYIYQDSDSRENSEVLETIYLYSFYRNLKSGISRLNEVTPRKDFSHLIHLKNIIAKSRQSVNTAYAIKQDFKSLENYSNLNLSYYLTDENLLTVFDISEISQLRKNTGMKLFLEISTNKEISDKFRQTFGKPAVMLFDDYGLINENTALINPLYLSYEEIRIIAERKASVIICPRDLVYFTNRYFPLDEFLSHGIKFSIGTGWLGEDIFKEARLLRHKYRELNISSRTLFESITSVPSELFFSNLHNGSLQISPNSKADLTFITLSDLRFQLYPENLSSESVCDFLIDSIASTDITDVMIDGDFLMRENRLGEDEDKIIIKASSARENLYRIGKYAELQKRRERKENVEILDLSSRIEDEIKLFTEAEQDSSITTGSQVKDEFRIKGRIPVFKSNSAKWQKNLFEEHDQIQIINTGESENTPTLNLLYSEIPQNETLDNEIMKTRISDSQLLNKQDDKKPMKDKMQNTESNVELPKDVKLRFGDE